MISCNSNIDFQLKEKEEVQETTEEQNDGTSKSQLIISNNMDASLVLGQIDFTSSSQNIDGTTPKANSLKTVQGIYSDFANDRLAIADRGNNRILIFTNFPSTNGESATIALGQPDLITNTENNGGRSATSLSAPKDVVWNGAELFVSDTGNNRTLVWTSFPTNFAEAADYVVGQPDMVTGTASTGGRSASTIKSYYAHSAFATENYLYTAEHGSNRLLIHPLPITSDFAAATYVIGPSDFVTYGSSTASDTSLDLPVGVWSNDQYIIIADRYNHRVVIHNNFPSTATGAVHDVVIGQVDFTGQSANQGGSVGANTLNEPHSVFYDGERLFIADTSNHRVLVFNSIPTANNASADYVIGQPDFTSNTSNQGGVVGANTLSAPSNLTYDSDCGCLLVGDKSNSRVLIYK